MDTGGRACFRSQLLKSLILISRRLCLVLSVSHPLWPLRPAVHLLIWLRHAEHMLCLFVCVFSGCSAELTLSQPLADHRWVFSFCSDIEALRRDFSQFPWVSTASRCSDEFCQLAKFICDYRHNHRFSSTGVPSRHVRAGTRLINGLTAASWPDSFVLFCGINYFHKLLFTPLPSLVLLLCYGPGHLSEHVTHLSYYVIYLRSAPIHAFTKQYICAAQNIFNGCCTLAVFLFPVFWHPRCCREIINQISCLVENTKMNRGQQLCDQGAFTQTFYLILNKPGSDCGFHFIYRKASHLL